MCFYGKQFIHYVIFITIDLFISHKEQAFLTFQWLSIPPSIFAAKNRISELEAELRETRNLANRYRDMSLRGKDRQQVRQSSEGEDEEADDSRKVTERDLDDDEAVYKRHVMRVVDLKSMKNTAPIRVQDVIRKNEVRR